MSKLTRIEDRAARQIHNAAFDAARAKGADFHCATMVGFAATNNPPTSPELCERCRRRGVGDGLTNPARAAQ